MTAALTRPKKSAKAHSKDQQALAEAERLAATHSDAVSLSNAIFAQATGILARVFTTRQEREAFTKTPEFRAIHKLISSKPQPPAESGPHFSGVFNLRLPKSLHEALAQEADREGVSLNQLCVAKLSLSMREKLGAKS